MGSDWNYTLLSEFAIHQKGFAFKSKDYQSTGCPVIRVCNFTMDSVDNKDLYCIANDIANKNKSVELLEDDVVIATVGSWPTNPASVVGKTVRIPKWVSGGLLNQNAVRLRVKSGDKYDQIFLYYLLKNRNFSDYIISTAQGSANQASITLKDIFAYRTYLPPKSERQQIAQHIDLLDKKIVINQQTNQTLEAIAQTLFKSWFVDFDPVKAKLLVLAEGGSAEEAERAAMCAISARDEASLNTLQTEQPEAYAELARTAALFPSAMQDSELGEIPVGWEVGALGDTYNVVMGQSPKGDTYNEVKEGQLFFQGRAEFGWRYPTPRLYTSSPKRVASKGDILMSVRAPVGDLNIALEDCCIGRGLSALRHNSGSTSFTYYQLKSLQTQLDRFNGEGTVFGSINQKDLKGLQVINPCSISIEAFNKFSLSLDKEIESRAIESMRLSELRDTLLPKLLSGELTVTDTTPPKANPPESDMLNAGSVPAEVMV